MATNNSENSNNVIESRKYDSMTRHDTAAVEGKWKTFSEWLHCICVVTFDLELGQAMELVYPHHVKLSEQEKTNICYLAFPDSNSGCMGDTQFHIRLRVAPGTQNTLLGPVHRQFNTQCIPVQRADTGHYWGFVYFRQTKDSSLPRGYFQKSLILLTRLPFFNLYYEVCSLIAARYFTNGFSVLETACENICSWPPLKAGEAVSLPLLGTVYQSIIPKANSKSHNDTETSSNGASHMHLHGPTLPPQILTSLHEIDIFRSLSSVISHIHMLWELVLISEPIVVMGTSPTDCSHMVQSLISLISPLSYCAESRPYFTIHDSEFKEFTQRPQGPPPIIIGVTNPFFTKPLQNWPHTIRLIDQQNATVTSSLLVPGISSMAGNSTNINQTDGAAKLRKVKLYNSKSLDYTPGVYTKYKPFLQKDKSVIKKIMHGIKTKRPASVQSALLRRHLLELTQSFMIPLERYMASLMPLQKDISPFKAAPNPHQFKQDDFLATLEQSGPQLTAPLKGNWEGLYKRFFRSPNFRSWYDCREKELRQTLQALQLQALSDADLNMWAQGKHEVEIVDMILKLKQKLKLYSETCDANQIETLGTSLKTSTRNQLLQHLENMKKSLPDDLKTILNDT